MYEENQNMNYNNTHTGSNAYSGGYSSYEISSNSPKAPQKKKSSGFLAQSQILWDNGFRT